MEAQWTYIVFGYLDLIINWKLFWKKMDNNFTKDESYLYKTCLKKYMWFIFCLVIPFMRLWWLYPHICVVRITVSFTKIKPVSISNFHLILNTWNVSNARRFIYLRSFEKFSLTVIINNNFSNRLSNNHNNTEIISFSCTSLYNLFHLFEHNTV